jgi:hypothetical protein
MFLLCLAGRPAALTVVETPPAVVEQIVANRSGAVWFILNRPFHSLEPPNEPVALCLPISNHRANRDNEANSIGCSQKSRCRKPSCKEFRHISSLSAGWRSKKKPDARVRSQARAQSDKMATGKWQTAINGARNPHQTPARPAVRPNKCQISRHALARPRPIYRAMAAATRRSRCDQDVGNFHSPRSASLRLHRDRSGPQDSTTGSKAPGDQNGGAGRGLRADRRGTRWRYERDVAGNGAFRTAIDRRRETVAGGANIVAAMPRVCPSAPMGEVASNAATGFSDDADSDQLPE